LKLAQFAGVTIPVNTVRDFVIDPLSSQPYNKNLSAALSQWKGASAAQQSSWVSNYTKGASKMTWSNGTITVPATNTGPVPTMINSLTAMARSGALDQALVTGGGFYTTNYTKPLLFVADGTYLANLAQKQHLLGSQWGMMNETGSYPGQAWLWLYLLVSGVTVQLELERRHPGLGLDGSAVAALAAGALHPRSAVHPAQGEDLPTDLARVLPLVSIADATPGPGPGVALRRQSRWLARCASTTDETVATALSCSVVSRSTKFSRTEVTWPGAAPTSARRPASVKTT